MKTMNARTMAVVSTLLLAAMCLALGGCAAGLLAGGVAAYKWEEWFKKDDPSDYRIFLNGYDIGASPRLDGTLTVRGARNGDYLVTVARPPEMRRGVHLLTGIQTGRPVDLSVTNPFEGVAITGTVRRDSAGGAVMPNVQVVAIRNGAARIAAAGPVSIPPQADSELEWLIGFSDSNGEFRLGPAKYGDWLVTTAVAGFVADARHVRVQAGPDGVAPLILTPDAGPQPGLVRGSVNSREGASIPTPLVLAVLEAPFAPTISDVARGQVEAAAGVNMPAGPWFEWRALATIGDDGGRYTLDATPGSHTIEAFRPDWRYEAQEVVVTEGGVTTTHFSLQRP